MCNETFQCNLVIFDMDGTLVDVEKRFLGLAQARVKALTRLVGPKVIEPWAKVSGYDQAKGSLDINGPLMSAPRREDLVVAATVIYTLGHKWGEAKRLSEEAYEMADELFFSDYSPSPMEGAEGALKRLKKAGFKLAIATNDRRLVAEKILRAMALKGLFDAVVGADDVENSKPAPDMVFLVCELCGIEPHHAVFFGDLPQDMEAGRAAGIGGLVAVRSNLVHESELDGLADCIINSFEEIIISSSSSDFT